MTDTATLSPGTRVQSTHSGLYGTITDTLGVWPVFGQMYAVTWDTGSSAMWSEHGLRIAQPAEARGNVTMFRKPQPVERGRMREWM